MPDNDMPDISHKMAKTQIFNNRNLYLVVRNMNQCIKTDKYSSPGEFKLVYCLKYGEYVWILFTLFISNLTILPSIQKNNGLLGQCTYNYVAFGFASEGRVLRTEMAKKGRCPKSYAFGTYLSAGQKSQHRIFRPHHDLMAAIFSVSPFCSILFGRALRCYRKTTINNTLIVIKAIGTSFNRSS